MLLFYNTDSKTLKFARVEGHECTSWQDTIEHLHSQKCFYHLSESTLRNCSSYIVEVPDDITTEQFYQLYPEYLI